jgi:predicted SAM-dependent methyltransferase
MRSQGLKNIYYLTLGKLSAASYVKHKLLPTLPKTGRVILNLGSGKKRLALPGVINIDGNPLNKPDIWLDVTLGLPFGDETVDLIYSSHMFEHLNEDQVLALLRNCHRVLKPNATIRIVTPNLTRSIQAYINGQKSFFSRFPDNRESLGGLFNNHLLCRDQHRLMFDTSFFQELLEKTGFENVREVSPSASRVLSPEDLAKLEAETEENFSSLFIEASRKVG